MKKLLNKIQLKKRNSIKLLSLNVQIFTVIAISSTISFFQQAPLALAKKIIIPETDLPGPSEYTQTNDLSTYFNENIFGNLTQTIIGLTAIAALLFTIFSGVRMVTAYGTEDAYGSAKKMFMISLVGLLVSMLSYTIVSIISSLQF